MLRRFRQEFSPRIQTDLLVYRVRLARILVIIFYIILAIWLAAEIAFKFLTPSEKPYPFAVNLISIVIFAILGTSVLWLISRQRLVTAGYLLASTLFIFATLSLFVFPRDIYLLGATYLISILAAGALIGGASTYPFAVGAIITVSWNWFRNWGTPLTPSGTFDPTASFVFLVSQITLYLGTAAILHSLSNQIHKTIQNLHNQADHLTNMAQTDALTGLANRRYLIDQLEREFARARRYHRPLSLVYLDLDDFKMLNDRHGHLFGDEVLRGAARSLKAVLRSTDLLARIGGDEFAVLLPETNLGGAENVALKLRKALAAYGTQLAPAIETLTFCAGVSQLREGDTSIDDILARADSAQYLAKARGKDDICTEVQLESP
jgi:diguanylate cyclase (GGDEF)-like protein